MLNIGDPLHNPPKRIDFLLKPTVHFTAGVCFKKAKIYLDFYCLMIEFYAQRGFCMKMRLTF